MKIAFPVMEDMGLKSVVHGHFGSAACFVIVDTETGRADVRVNRDLGHAHGGCQPLKALGGEAVDAVGVGGIGLGALNKLSGAGIRVLRAVEGTVGDNAGLAAGGKLPAFNPGDTCAGHQGGDCAH